MPISTDGGRAVCLLRSGRSVIRVLLIDGVRQDRDAVARAMGETEKNIVEFMGNP